MSDSDNQTPKSERRVVSGRLRVEPWEAKSSAQPQFTLSCGPDALRFISDTAHPAMPHEQRTADRSCNSVDIHAVVQGIVSFCEFGTKTKVIETVAATFGGEELRVSTYVNEFWTKKQRAANSLHEVSYHGCFKPQLPRFWIQRLTQPGDIVYDPFLGRGTTLLEAALLGRVPIGCDINPLSVFLCRPRFKPPTLTKVARRLAEIDFTAADEMPEDLLVFYHPATLREVCALRAYLLRRQANSQLDSLDEWIWMVSLHTLTGHSHGFFSGYTMPPNAAVSVKRQKKLNEKRGLTPPRKHVAVVIAGKTRELLADCDDETRQNLAAVRVPVRLLTSSASTTPEIPTASVALVMTSPPFLNVIDYAGDNWLRNWFIGVDARSVKFTVTKKLEAWQQVMSDVFRELHRVLQPGGFVAFEVGEVRGGKLKLEEAVLPCGVAAGLRPELVLINDQNFSKTSHCWGQENNVKGTNTNRIVLFRKEQ
jgi:tRNA G10  N-methylase Trm11